MFQELQYETRSDVPCIAEGLGSIFGGTLRDIFRNFPRSIETKRNKWQ
jgi:hypothetical protein